MAIGNINMGTAERPYVHSNYERFSSQVSVADVENYLGHRNLISQSIAELISIRNSLKTEADNFLKGFPPGTIISDILMMPDTYAGIATQIIYRPDIIRSLVAGQTTMSRKSLQNLFSHSNSQIGQQVLKEIYSSDVENVATKEVARLIANAMSIDGVITDAGTQIKSLFGFNPQMQHIIDKRLSGAITNRLKSSKGKIVDYIEEILIKSRYKTTSSISSVDSFWKAFSEAFRKETKNITFSREGYTPEDYLKKLEPLLRQTLTANIIDLRNAGGKTGEKILAAVTQADTETILKITDVSSLSEDQLIKQYQNILGKMNTHHTDGKESQTDVLIKNVKTGQVVRAQSKTSITTYTFKDEELDRMLSYVQRSTEVYKLLRDNPEYFPIGNLDRICYVMANALWFKNHVSVTGHREGGYLKLNSGTHEGQEIFKAVVEALNAYLQSKATTFMGITIQEGSKEIVADARKSNIFYIENGRLNPTYLLLDEIIKDLEQYQKEGEEAVKNLRFVIEQNSVTWPYPSAPSFLIEKWHGLNSGTGHGKFDYEVGYTQGQAAMSSLLIHGNFSAILRYTSVVVGK